MSFSRHEYDTIRKYLLGQLTREDHEEFEHRFFSDDGLFKALQAAEDDLIDDFLTGDLSEDDVVMFHQKFLVGAERKQKLLVVKAWRKYAAAHAGEKPPRTIEPVLASRWQQLFSPTPLRFAALAAVVLIAALGVWRILFFESDIDKGLQALNAAYPQQRPLESRITELNYAPFVTTRGPGANTVNDDELRRAELILLDAVKKKPTPAAHHALGRVYLAKKEFDKAIEQFEEALKGDPNNAQVFADLGAALLEKSTRGEAGPQTGEALKELSRSLENLSKALELDGSLLEALFNRALGHQRMMLPRQAEEDWREYLKKDSTSPWAEEARNNLTRLEHQQSRNVQPQELLERFLSAFQAKRDDQAYKSLSQTYTSAGNYITNSLLDSYLDLQSQGRNRDATKRLEELTYLGYLERDASGDRYTADLAQFYPTSSPHRISALLAARKQMKEGYRAFTYSNLDKAIEHYAEAKRIFTEIGDTAEATFAVYRIAHCYVVQPNIPMAKATLDRLIPTCQEKNYTWLLAQCYFATANLLRNLSEYSKAIEGHSKSLRLLEEINDVNGIVKNLIQLADEYHSLNDTSKSLDYLRRTLQIVSNNDVEKMQVWGAYIAIAFNCISLDFHRAGLSYQEEALLLALEMNIPLILSRTFEYIGVTNRNLGLFAEAVQNTRKALEIGKKLGEEPNGLNMVAHSSLQLADIYREAGDHDKALKAYDESIQLYTQLGFQYYSYAAHKGKLLSFVSLKDDYSTEAELKTVLSLFERYRSRIYEESNRNRFFDLEQGVYDLAVDFEFSRKNDPWRAFEYSEQSRARSLRDMTLRGTRVLDKDYGPEINIQAVANSFTLAQLQQEMPEQAQIVQYAVLDKRLLIWFVTKHHIATAEAKISAETLTNKVQKYLHGVSTPSAGKSIETSSQAKELYALLILPIERSLDRAKQVWIVPDKSLHYLPFGALVSSSGKFLIEDYRLGLAPSSSVFLGCSKSASQRGIKKEKLLSVGNPTFDRSAFPMLPDLPAASREAQAIADYYPLSSILVRADAKKSNVQRELENSDVVHLALHYVVDERSSLFSQLVLAKGVSSSPQDSGTLSGYEIYNMKLPKIRLVVLSACQTGIEEHYRGEGPIGMARPFIAAGVPLIIASLWPVDSDATAELMIAFHKHRKLNGLPTADALRRAQVDMLESNSSQGDPYYWASFITIGGYAEF